MKEKIAISAVLCAAAGLATGQVNAQKKPNVLLLFSDQHNKSVMGFEGHPDVLTPNLDRLASESVVFDRAYCTVGVSVPSRMSLMSGLYPRTLGMMANDGTTSVIEDKAVSMATMFKENGYDTYAFGKRHLRGRIDDGWDVIKADAVKEGEENYVRWIEEQGYLHKFSLDWAAEFGRGPLDSPEENNKYPTGDLGTRMSALPDGYTMEAYTAMNTIDMLKHRKDSDKPFFCWASFYRPHQPYTPIKKYMDMYDVSEWGEGRVNGSSIKMPENFYHPTELLPPMAQGQRKGRNKVWNADKAFQNEQLWRNYIGSYYALVTEIDHWIGEIIKTLEEEGLEDETIIIYTADHGDFVGHHGVVEKCAAGQNVYEDILNIPLIFKYPGKTKASRNHELVSLIDIYPTLADLLGLDLPENMIYELQGESLADLLLGKRHPKRKYFVSESWSQATVITDNYKLGMWKEPVIRPEKTDFRDFGDMFFDYRKNPLEVENDYSHPEYKKIINKLKCYYEDFQARIPDDGVVERIEQQKTKSAKDKNK